MVDLPGRDEPTMNAISFAGRKVETLERTRMVRRDGYAKVMLLSARLPEHLAGIIFLRARRFLDCGVDVARAMRETIKNSPLARMIDWGMNVEHLHVARCNKTRPENRHHVLLPDKLEPKQNS